MWPLFFFILKEIWPLFFSVVTKVWALFSTVKEVWPVFSVVRCGLSSLKKGVTFASNSLSKGGVASAILCCSDIVWLVCSNEKRVSFVPLISSQGDVTFLSACYGERGVNVCNMGFTIQILIITFFFLS